MLRSRSCGAVLAAGAALVTLGCTARGQSASRSTSLRPRAALPDRGRGRASCSRRQTRSTRSRPASAGSRPARSRTCPASGPAAEDGIPRRDVGGRPRARARRAEDLRGGPRGRRRSWSCSSETETTEPRGGDRGRQAGPAAHRRGERRGRASTSRATARRRSGVIGCGWQARAQVACIREAVPSIERVVAYCRSEDRLAGVLRGGRRRGRREPPRPGRAGRRRDRHDLARPGAARRVAAGPARSSARSARTTLAAASSTTPSLERAAFVCCDSLEQAKRESGDLIEPVEAGVLDWLEVHELQEVVAGELPGPAGRRRHRRLQVERPRRMGRRRRRASRSSARASAASGASSRCSRCRSATTSSRRARGSPRAGRAGARAPAACARLRTYGSSRISVERAAALVLADHVGGEPLLLRGTRGQERERVAEEFRQPGHDSILASARVMVRM